MSAAGPTRNRITCTVANRRHTRSRAMAADPWALFGSDSDEDQATAMPSKPQPPMPPLGTGNPTRSAKKKRHLWEALLPKFHEAAVPEGGAGFPQQPSASPRDREASGDERLGEGGTGATRAPFSAPPVYQHPSVRYEACLPHRGGGRGFIASADISPGTLLLVERRYLPMPTAVDCGLAGGVGQEELCLKWILALPLPRLKEVLGELRWLHPQKLEDLPAEEAENLMTRHEEVAKAMISDLGERSTETGLDVRGIVRLFGALQSNGFASGIYLHPAMTNHSCRANAIKWQAGKSMSDRGLGEAGGGVKPSDPADSNLSEIRATELIRAGEEITISYLEPREIALPSRQVRLKDQFGFDCDCRLCKSSDSGSGDGVATPLEAFLSVGEEPKPDNLGVLVGPGQGGGGAGVTEGGGGDGHEEAEGLGGGPSQGRICAMEAAEGRREEGEGGQGVVQDGEEEEEGEDEGGDDASTRGTVAMNVLERRLEATESVVELSKAKEVRWAGVLSELLSYRRQAAKYLGCRHIALARADKLIAKACIAILQGSTEEAQSDAECAESVKQASAELPFFFGGSGDALGPLEPLEGSFKTRLVVVFLGALLSRRKTQLLYLGDSPHPEAGACLADLSQAMAMLLAQGSEGEGWINRLPGCDDNRAQTGQGGLKEHCEASLGGKEGVWWADGVRGASLFERECDKAAKLVGRLFDAAPSPPPLALSV